jgi:hypothetical protein
MKVFADFHHEDLFHSLYLLFEKRLGAELYRPIGLDWYTEKYWNVYPHPATANQFLSTDQGTNKPKDIHGNFLSDRECLNARYFIQDGVYYIYNPTKDNIQRAITLDVFKQMQFDIVISSVPQHIPLFNNLIKNFQPKAKHIFQVGNSWREQPGVANVMASTASFTTIFASNIVFYHQEFDRSIFDYQPPICNWKVYSYIHYMQRKDLMNAIAANLPGFEFRSFGAGMEDHISKTSDIASKMKSSAFTYHYKPEGDGFGHSIHNTFACGRPAIVYRPFYENKLAGELMQHGTTCIDIAKFHPHEVAELIKFYSRPDNHLRMCENAHNRFKQLVNFDEEETKIRQFIDRLV